MKHLMRYLRGSTETVLVHMPERTKRGIIKAQADSDWAGCHSTRKSTSCGMIWWSGVLISSYARTQSASTAISMESRVGLGKARHVTVRYLWLQQLVADKTIRLVKVKGTQHPPDVGTKHLSKQGMLHAKSMLGLMEPEALAPYGYEVPDSSGVRDKLDKSANLVAIIRALSMSGDRWNRSEFDVCIRSRLCSGKSSS
eukprot:6491800-Amphidinium_carterae.2